MNTCFVVADQIDPASGAVHVAERGSAPLTVTHSLGAASNRMGAFAVPERGGVTVSWYVPA